MIFKSTDKNVALHALFPTLIYHANLESHVSYKESLATVFEENAFNVEVNEDTQQPAGEYHGKILLHQEDGVQPFFQELALHVAKYLTVMRMRTDVYSLHVLKSWFVICRPDNSVDEAIRPHNHSCSDISFVYYVDVPDDCPAIRFHSNGRLSNSLFESAFHDDPATPEKNSIFETNWWNTDVWSIRPREGDLVMFPGHQLHSVESNKSSMTRISVAGDLALVLKPEFRNLEFGRTSPQLWKELALQPSPNAVVIDDLEVVEV